MNPYQFFLRHAGHSHNPATESPMQGRIRNARALAKAERAARDAGISFEWGKGDTLSSDWIADNADGGRNCNPWQTWYCVARAESDGRHLASLYGIDFGRDREPWGDPYRRVIEAELAAESLTQLERII